MIKIYIDMDGVLVNFDEGIEKANNNSLKRAETWARHAEKDLIARLPKEYEEFRKQQESEVETDELVNRFARSLTGNLKNLPEVKAFRKAHSAQKGIKSQMILEPDFYLNLEPMPDMELLLSYVRTIDPNPSILTAPVSGKPEIVENCCKEKREWVKTHIPDFTGEVICDDKKFEYAHPEPNVVKILIDDRSKNTIPWKEAGGIAVLHISAVSTIAKLKELMGANKLLESFVQHIVENEIKKKPIAYTGVVLTDESKNRLLSLVELPEGWEKIAHHMTINMGPFKGDRTLLGQTVKLTAVSVAADDKVMAVGVESPSVPSVNPNPHITLAVNRAGGGKPVMSNKLTNWKPLKNPITLEGVVEEVPQ